jgi:hypothetical protein
MVDYLSEHNCYIMLSNILIVLSFLALAHLIVSHEHSLTRSKEHSYPLIVEYIDNFSITSDDV